MLTLQSGMLWAFAACAVYMLISAYTGDFFPFSRYAMYASAPKRRQGAVPMMRVDGERVRMGDYHRFQGLDPATIYPEGTPCSLEWMVHEARRYLTKHAEPEGDPGPIEVEWGFLWLTLDDTGHLEQEWRGVQTGRAWPRS